MVERASEKERERERWCERRRKGGRCSTSVLCSLSHCKAGWFYSVFLAAVVTSLWTGDFCIHRSRLKGYSTPCPCNILTPSALFTARLCDWQASWWMPIQAICIAWHALIHTGLIFSSQEVLCLELHAVGWIEREKLLLYSCLFVTCGNRNWASDIGRNARWVSSCKFRRLFPAARGALALHLNLWSPAPSPLSPFQPRSLEWCVWSPEERKESLKLDPSPQMTGSNSMSSGYCSLDEESDDFTFFTAKSTFFRQPQAKQIPKVVYEHEMDGIVKIERIYSQLIQKNEKMCTKVCIRKCIVLCWTAVVETVLWPDMFWVTTIPGLFCTLVNPVEVVKVRWDRPLIFLHSHKSCHRGNTLSKGTKMSHWGMLFRQ